jgi:hypothetical protein
MARTEGTMRACQRIIWNPNQLGNPRAVDPRGTGGGPPYPETSMANQLADELRSLADRLSAVAAAGNNPENKALFSRVWDEAEGIGRSWSGSNIGYHAWVYYEDFQPPPPGAVWSMEWGKLRGPFSGGGSEGEWRQFNPDDVLRVIYQRAGDPNLDEIERLAAEAEREFEASRREAKSMIQTAKEQGPDGRLDEILKEIDDIKVLTLSIGIMVQLPRGQLMSRDVEAMAAGRQGAPHQQVFARINMWRSTFGACDELAQLAKSAAAHLDRRERVSPAKVPAKAGGRIFIGHGHSSAWRALKDFLEVRAGLPTEEFNRVSAAGVATVSRLDEMLDNSGMAFLVLTAEDEHGGKLAARQNVIHEAGLFQGRLGFKRAIILREETCEEFSNIHGLGQLPFPAGRISAVFEDVRQVLEREGMIAPPPRGAE